MRTIFSVNRRFFPARAAALVFLAVVLGGCGRGCGSGSGGGANGPSGSAITPGSADYTAIVSAFTIGLVALQTGPNDLADKKLQEVTRLAPQEPAGWADLGLLALREANTDAAAANLQKAKALAPDNAQIYALLGLVDDRLGKTAETVADLRQAVKLAPNDVRAQYALAQAIEKQGDTGDAEAQQIMTSILTTHPQNLEAMLESARLAAKSGDAETLRALVEQLAKLSGKWPSEAKTQLKSLQSAAAQGNVRPAAVQVQFLKNTLKQASEYEQSVADLTTAASSIGVPLEQFVKLPPMVATPAAPDMALTFTAEPIPGAGKAEWMGAVALNSAGAADTKSASGFTYVNNPKAPDFITADGKTVHVADGVTLAFPGGPKAVPPAPHGILTLDINYDFRTDLALAGVGGLKLYQQTKDGKFTDVTAKTTLPASIVDAACYGAWAADVEATGNVDILLAMVSGPPIVLRNNGNGTFAVMKPFAGVSAVRDMLWLDLDGDGSNDVVMLDTRGQLHVFMNARRGQFHERPVPASLGKLAALAAADLDGDGKLDVAALRSDGTLLRLSDRNDGRDWDTAEIAHWEGASVHLTPETANLLTADLDNNGGLDLIASGPADTRIWLRDQQNKFQPLSASPDARVLDVADVNGDGRLDLLGISKSGQPVRLINKGTKNYHWQELHPQAKPDAPVLQRINSFGIGGEMEVRSGLLAQKQPITGPTLHFGLGDYAQAEAVRAIWPNGSVRADFGLKADQTIIAEQHLQISCPFLFAWNGKEMGFVTDCIWRSPLGLRINAQDTAGVMQTEDWVKIRGDQLVPKDGYYDLSITAELRETHFFDHLSLMTVDHPAGTDIWVDERFAVPPPPHQVYATSPLHPVAHAWDDTGNDVTELIKERDGRYLDNFGRGAYQGITRDHWVEVELGPDAPKSGPLWLIANGWILPTNSSVNVAVAQSHHTPPQGLSLEVPDGKGNWVVAQKGLGFPEGKVKTILLNLDGVFRPGAPRRLRLRTNLEIFWDSIQWAAGLPQTPLKMKRILAGSAELRYRGFSVIEAKDASSPELPQSYDRVASTVQKWRTLIGYYTRFGDVRELLQKVDDRYVIMNAGDELALRFPAPPPPPTGWVRDFVLIGDGWVKDGDFNTTFSKTVLPLPAHNQPNYNTPPGRLEDDPVYRRHARDWQEYHTRYVVPQEFQHGLRPWTVQ